MPKFKALEYIEFVRTSLYRADENLPLILSILHKAKKENRRILILGNGGSLAIAQHLAQDLLKLCNVRAWTINCPSIITAHANDDGFNYCYFNPAIKLLDPGDIVMIFSCSGKSPNYIEFVSGFPNMENPIISIVGTNGGFLKEKSTVSIHIESDDYQVCETAFCVVADVIVKDLLEEE